MQLAQKAAFGIAFAGKGFHPETAGQMRGRAAEHPVGHRQPHGAARFSQQPGFVQPLLPHRRAIEQGILVACLAGASHLKTGYMKLGNLCHFSNSFLLPE